MTFTHPTQTQGRQDTQAQSKSFSKMADESEVLAAISLLFLVFEFVYRRIQKSKRRARSVMVRPIFRQRQRQGDFHNLVRELQLGDREFFSLHSLPISRLKWNYVILLSTSLSRDRHGTDGTAVFFYLAFAFAFHVWNANASTNASARKWNFFLFLHWRLCLRLHLPLGSSHVYSLRLHLQLSICVAHVNQALVLKEHFVSKWIWRPLLYVLRGSRWGG